MHKYSFTIKFEEIILLDQDLILDLSSCALLLSFQDDNQDHKTINRGPYTVSTTSQEPSNFQLSV